MKTTFQHIGSVSSATMRPEDLIPTFIDTLTELNDERSLLPTSATAEQTEATKAEYARLTDVDRVDEGQLRVFEMRDDVRCAGDRGSLAGYSIRWILAGKETEESPSDGTVKDEGPLAG